MVFSHDTGTTETLNYAIQLQQPLFRWDRWIALKRADKTIAQAEANYAASEQDLAARVAARYFAVLSARDSLQAETLNKEAIGRQLEQNETRFEVGLIAITDVLESRAAYDQSVAAEIEAKRVLATARENLREITGAYVENLAAPGQELALKSPEPANEDTWVERALAQDRCGDGGTSFLVVLNAFSGGNAGKALIDINRDGIINEKDLVSAGLDDNDNQVKAYLSGLQLPGNLQFPSILQIDKKIEFVFLSSSTGEIYSLREKATRLGITYWKELLQ